MHSNRSPGKLHLPYYKCPKCGGSNFKRWELPHPLILFWVIFPALAFNEIILGQRIPKTMLICKECDLPEFNRSYVPCPSCKTLHLGLLASSKRAFGNWRGIRCPFCNERIPYLWNLFSLVILGLSFPIWALPYFLHFRKQPLPPLYFLVNGQAPKPKKITNKTWIYMGAGWGAAMWVIMNFLTVFTRGQHLPSWDSMLYTLPIYALGGFLFGFFMWLFLGRKPRKKALSKQGVSPNP